MLKKIELLAPARDADTGIEAVLHGADAVYIGAPRFSARSAAGCNINDIARLVDFAHLYSAKVYVALNTILYEDELSDAERIIKDCWKAKADALIIQDMGILKLDLPPIPLHASTQCDNRSVETISFFEQMGFSQVVLARELSIIEISDIAKQTDIKLETFIHGALCASYSGRCYASQYMLGRSANRGECAQICRLPYTLSDSAGQILAENRYLLSMRDLNRFSALEQLLDAGVSSLKIEGRLKDVSYVKNITAFYRQALDNIFKRRKEYVRSSSGSSEFFFTTDPYRTFNRGFTDYFPTKGNTRFSQPDTPKSTGEPVGTVSEAHNNWFSLIGESNINNGDGLCFFNKAKELVGFRVNRSENGRIYPAEKQTLTAGTPLFRNFSIEFDKKLASKTAERTINIKIKLSETTFGLSLEATDEDGFEATVAAEIIKEKSLKPQPENIIKQLSKLGGTPFKIEKIDICLTDSWFIPVSVLNSLRRRLVKSLISVRKSLYKHELRKKPNTRAFFHKQHLTYESNVANSKAVELYSELGVKSIESAFEMTTPVVVKLMTSRHCILREMGRCKKQPDAVLDYVEPLYLLSGNNKMRLMFDCRKCEMQVLV